MMVDFANATKARHLALLLLLVLAFSGCASPRPASQSRNPNQDALVSAMTRRLELAGEVAWIKYVNGLPVRDPARESAVLEAMTAEAAARRLDPARVRTFFAAQIAASCAQQEKLIHLWSRGAPLPAYAPRSLRADVRRDIDGANRALLAALARNPDLPRGFRSRVTQALRSHGVCWRATQLATAPL